LFKRGKEFERGRSPLSPELPSPAINICGFLPVSLAGEALPARSRFGEGRGRG